MATRNAASTRVTAATLASSTLSSQEAGLLLPIAAMAAIKGKATIEQGKAQGASALAVMIAGFASEEVADRDWTFDMVGKDGQVKFHVRCKGLDQFGGTDGDWRAEPKKAQTAYKTALQADFFQLPEPSPAVWTMLSKAAVIVRAIRQEGMAAAVKDGKLVLTGGTTDKAKAMADAKSLEALGKAAKGETGTNRNAPQNEKGGEGKGGEGGEGEAPAPATPEKILRDATWIVQAVAKGDIALGGSELSFIRAIAKAVNDNPDVFAPDVPEG
jgi:hypothetical protein